MMTDETISAKWNEIKGRLRKVWGELTDDEIEQTKGDTQILVATIQKKTGEAKQKIEDKLEELAMEASSMTERAGAAAREYADQATHAVQNAFNGISSEVHDRIEQVENLVRERPRQASMITFGTGLLAGVILGLVIRGR